MPEVRRDARGGGTYRTWHIKSRYFGGLLLGSAVSPTLLRRHLMVWKMFVSHYMLDAIELLCMDDAVLVGLWFGDGRIVSPIGYSRCQYRGRARAVGLSEA